MFIQLAKVQRMTKIMKKKPGVSGYGHPEYVRDHTLSM